MRDLVDIFRHLECGPGYSMGWRTNSEYRRHGPRPTPVEPDWEGGWRSKNAKQDERSWPYD